MTNCIYNMCHKSQKQIPQKLNYYQKTLTVNLKSNKIEFVQNTSLNYRFNSFEFLDLNENRINRKRIILLFEKFKNSKISYESLVCNYPY
jgi:hypothetical protein